MVYYSYLEISNKSVMINYTNDPIWGRGFQFGTDYGC